jgi:anaerobic ribonucleoside-triphosphate reductase activating protein
MNQLIRLAETLSSSQIYGPGNRFVIWVQGCSLECPGCWNKDFWSTELGDSIDIEILLSEILETENIEGITILGGEPLEQPEVILKLIKSVKQNNLTVMLYTGYEENELDETQLECVSSSDIVIMGRYESSLRNTNLRWRGSSNQEIKMNSNRYKDIEIEEREEVEITVSKDGKISVSGYPQRWLLKVLNEL